eukprot:1096810-Amphidinium_carterae.1
MQTSNKGTKERVDKKTPGCVNFPDSHSATRDSEVDKNSDRVDLAQFPGFQSPTGGRGTHCNAMTQDDDEREDSAPAQ